jgi:hypothetical protein
MSEITIDEMVDILSKRFISYLTNTARENSDIYQWQYFEKKVPDRLSKIANLTLTNNNLRSAILKTIKYMDDDTLIIESINDAIYGILEEFTDDNNILDDKEFRSYYPNDKMVFNEIIRSFTCNDTLWIEKVKIKII